MTTAVASMDTPETTRRRAARRATSAAVLTLSRGEKLRIAIGHLLGGRYPAAEAIVRQHLSTHSRDVAALCLLGDLAARTGVHAEAERLFRLALSYAPLFSEAQINLAGILARRDAISEAIALLGEVIADEPDRVDAALLRVTLLGQIGAYSEAADACAAVLAQHSDSAAAWLAFGHLQKTLGNPADCIKAFHRAIALDPRQGEAWWALANLKTYVFAPEEVARMESLIAESSAHPALSAQLHFALGKSDEDAKRPSKAFAHYAAGNTIQRRLFPYDATAMRAEVDRSIRYFTAERFAARDTQGNRASDPIFIVGLPRAGSTLIEQILASHSQIEGTAELPYIPMLVHRLLAERWTERDLTYPAVLEALPPDRLNELGQTYLAAAAVHRTDGRRFFIDKLPNNWSYIGFIGLILPNAKIIDARRSPMACGWSNYKQWYARGQEFSYAMSDIGAYYRDYVRSMAHFDLALPGAVHRVEHERLIDDPEREIRHLLDYLELPFEIACLRPHENTRPVRTASSEQVRRPISRDAVDQWQLYAPWLDELRSALGV